MNSVEFLSHLRTLDIAVRLDGDQLQVDAPRGALTDDLRAQLSTRKAELVALLRESGTRTEAGGIERIPRDSPLPLSPVQQGLWLLDQMEPDSAAYVMSNAMRLHGELDAAALGAGLSEIVRRHEPLRTVFRSHAGAPHQVVNAAGAVDLPVVDLRGLPEDERIAEAERLAAANAHETFDLAAGPLLRVKLLRLGEQDHVLLMAAHHIVFDGWSAGIFARELSALYAAHRTGAPSPLPEPPIQFVDFASWQRRTLEAGERDRHLAYWTRQLAGDLEPLELPADRPRRDLRDARGASCSLELSTELTRAVEQLCRDEQVTPAMALLAAFELLMHKQSGQTDIVVGTPVAGRTRAETEGLIGFFVNTVVMRTDFSAPCSFRELVQQVRGTAIDSYAHQDTAFEELVAFLAPRRDLTRTPIFQVFFNHVSVEPAELDIAGVSVEPFGPAALESKFDLTFYTDERDGRLNVLAVFNRELFDEQRIRELLEQYRHLLDQVTRSPERALGDYSLVTDAARGVLPDPVAPLEPDADGVGRSLCLPELGSLGERVAVEGSDARLTYAELDAQADRLARRLVAAGLRRGEIVAVLAERAPALVWVMIGTLRAGGAFALIDPAYPDQALADRWRAADPRGLIVLGGGARMGPEMERLVDAAELRFRIDAAGGAGDDGPLADPADLPAVGVDDLAYVAFTSGTTGGVKVISGTHGPVAHFLDWQRRAFGLGADDRFTMLSGLAHDPLLRDVFAPLWAGGTLCVPSGDVVEEATQLAAWMRASRPSIVHLAPPMAQLLSLASGPEPGESERLDALRYAFLGGDLLTGEVVQQLRGIAPNVTCVNFYGATETPQAMGCYTVPPGVTPRERVPIGSGIDAVQLLVLTPADRPAGVGELGEIVVRTRHLSLGYVGDEALNRQRFTRNPLTGTAADPVYRTGDLGRYLPDGAVEFVGRRDAQVKLRGFRVELGEIEASLRRHDAVREAAATVWETEAGDQRLVAYVVTGDGYAGAADLRKHLRARLPDYMIPQHFVDLLALPRTPNGKLDRRSLPSPLQAAGSGKPPDPPVGETERLIAAVWKEVIGDVEVSRTDNFFELGGHSLLVIKAIALIEERTGWRPSPRLLILEQLHEIARHCEGDRRRSEPHARGLIARLKGFVS